MTEARTDKRLSAIKRRVCATTMWPWRAEDGRIESDFVHPDALDLDPGADPDGGWTVAEVALDADAEFIAHAPEDVLYLLDYVRILRDQLSES